MSRRLLAAGCLAGLLVLSGCLGFGGVSQDDVCKDATYDWQTDANVTYRISQGGEYEAVKSLDGRSHLELYSRDGLGNDHPVEVRAVKFRYPNGTVVGCEAIDVGTGDRRTQIELPADRGQLAYTAPSSPKQFASPVYAEGSHEVILPPGRRTGNFLFGSVQPSSYETEMVDGQVRVYWEDVTAERISVQYYLERDVYIFYGLVAITGVIAVIGIVYYYRKVRALERRREEAGLDVDADDDEFDDDQPPGFG